MASRSFRPRFTFLQTVLVLGGLLLLFPVAGDAGPGDGGNRRDKIRMNEGGFRVKNFPQCKWDGRRPRFPQRDQIKPIPPALTDMECGQGSWGESLYFSYVKGQFAGEPFVTLSRMDEAGNVAGFTGIGLFDIGSIDMSFAPPSWREGEEIFLTIWPSDSFGPTSWIHTFAPDGSQGSQAFSFPDIRIGSSAVDPTGAFGGDFFYGRAGELLRQDVNGVVSVFAPLGTLGDMRFGPGGAWGDDLYLSGHVVAPDGTVTAFPVGFSEFDWAFGARFEGDMFVVIFESEEVLRVRPDGTSSVFATGTRGPIAFCGGALWLGGPDGCHRITPRGN